MLLNLSTPLGDDARSLRIGDEVFLSGMIVTARDSAHRMLLDQNMDIAEMHDGVVYHCGPLVKDNRVISAGPTTSMRMEPYTPYILQEKGARLIIGKGGMGEETSLALQKTGGAYLSFLGGGGALAAARLYVKDVLFLDRLGMAEAMWLLEAKDFGPLTVTMDSTGASLYRDVVRDSIDMLERLSRTM